MTSTEHNAIILEQLATYTALQTSKTNNVGASVTILRQEASKARMNIIALVYTTILKVHISSNIVFLLCAYISD